MQPRSSLIPCGGEPPIRFITKRIVNNVLVNVRNLPSRPLKLQRASISLAFVSKSNPKLPRLYSYVYSSRASTALHLF